MSKLMILTVGTGRERTDIAGAISLSIERENPAGIVFLASPLSKRETLPLVKQPVLKNRNIKEEVFEETDDVEELYLKYTGIIRGIINDGFTAEDIVIDYTSGTKSMSAALFAAGVAMGVGAINYVAGKRDSTGRVIPGRERPLSIKPNMLFAEIKIKGAQELFNRYQFQAALLLLRQLKDALKDVSIAARVDFLLKLLEAYSFWDTFKLSAAANLFGRINSEGLIKNHPKQEVFLKNLALVTQSNTHKYSVHRLVDLLQNIYRRMEEGKYDDAQARIYRLFEYMAQIKLYQDHNKIETEQLNVDRLPSRLQAKYEKMAGPRPDLKLSMVRAFELLADLHDALGAEFMQQYTQDDSALRKLLNQRNKSILAHGFKAIEKEDCEKLIAIAKEFLNKYFTDWEKEQDKAVFLKL